MAVTGVTGWSQLFGRSLKDLARAGRSPAVLLDCLRHLGARGLTVAGLFGAGAGVDKRKLLALRQLYDSGKRPLKSRGASKDPYLVSNLLLLWLGSLPEPLLPAEALPELLGAQRGDDSTRRSRMLAIRTCLKQTEPFIIEAMYPLFEFLHHWWINQPDREAALQHLGALFAPAVFGSPQEAGLTSEDAGLLQQLTEALICEYRPLFTQPYAFNRYEQDAARVAHRAAARAAGSGSGTSSGSSSDITASCVSCSPPPGGWLEGGAVMSPVLGALRCAELSVFAATPPCAECGGTCGSPPGAAELFDRELLAALWAADAADASSDRSPERVQHDQHELLLPEDSELDGLVDSLLDFTVAGMVGLGRVAELPTAAVVAAPAPSASKGCCEWAASPRAVLAGAGADRGSGASSDSDSVEFPLLLLTAAGEANRATADDWAHRATASEVR